jgi:hypothetical protein
MITSKGNKAFRGSAPTGAGVTIMSKALTPSQLKAELETQKDDALLKACLYALNEIPNRRLSGPYASTYALAEQVSKLLQRCK